MARTIEDFEKAYADLFQNFLVLRQERDLLRSVVVRYGDRKRMSNAETAAMQAVIDLAFEDRNQLL